MNASTSVNIERIAENEGVRFLQCSMFRVLVSGTIRLRRISAVCCAKRDFLC